MLKGSHIGDEKTGLDEIPLEEEGFVVKVFTNAKKYDYRAPWKEPRLERWTGSGFAIQDRKIITNAHVARGAGFIRVKLAHDSEEYKATVCAIRHECDLAVLEVENDEFWEKVRPVAIGETPKIGSKIKVIGFPAGGEGVCTVTGHISRMENHVYAHSYKVLLTVQVTAAINPGNSGGPVLSDGKVVGVVHQGMAGQQLTGYMIPTNVLRHFLEQIDKQSYGFPGLSIKTQTMKNPNLRDHYRMQNKHSGILVTDVAALSSANEYLKKGDVILKVNGITIRNDGTVSVPAMRSVAWHYVVTSLHIGDTVSLTVLRDNQECDVSFILEHAMDATTIIGALEFDKAPTYFIVGGSVVMQPVTFSYLQDNKDALYPNRQKNNMGDQMIVINQILENDNSMGYDECSGDIVEFINDRRIKNMADVVEAVESHDGEKHVILTEAGKTICIPNLAVQERAAILSQYDISRDRSSNLLKKENTVQELIQQFCSTTSTRLDTLSPVKLAKTSVPFETIQQLDNSDDNGNRDSISSIEGIEGIESIDSMPDKSIHESTLVKSTCPLVFSHHFLQKRDLQSMDVDSPEGKKLLDKITGLDAFDRKQLSYHD